MSKLLKIVKVTFTIYVNMLKLTTIMNDVIYKWINSHMIRVLNLIKITFTI